MREHHRRLYFAALVMGAAAVAAFVMVGGSGAGAAPGNGKAVGAAHAASTKGKGKAVGAAAHAAPASGSVGGGKASGDTTAPQPPSKADFTGHGANVHGPYDSTRDGSPSGNGNGIGKAIGKPCAGCVGKADNKNPHGQMPNGSDANAGYECDRNHGIGRTNPAHTGCTTASTPGCTTDCSTPGCTTDCSSPGCTTDCGSPGCTTDCSSPGCTTDCGAPGGDSPPSGLAAPAAVSPQAPADVAAANAAPVADTPDLANTGAINAGMFAGIAGVLVILGVAALFLSGRITRRPTD